MKILLLDTEVAPNLGTFWGIFNVNIGINQLLETSRVMCYAAKWLGHKEIMFTSEHKTGREDMIKELHGLLDQADAVVHYNGNKFDIPVINREFLLFGMPPPDSYKNIDLLRTMRKRFRFVSNKLDHVCRELGLGKKEEHEGHELWLKCMDGDDNAWKRMEKYNKQDVALLEKLYFKILPWIHNHPNHNLYLDNRDTLVCPNCGSTRVIRKGVEHLKAYSYQRYRCQHCHTALRGTKNLKLGQIPLTQCGA